MPLTNIIVVVHEAVAAIRVMRCITIPGDVFSHAAQVIPAVRDAATWLAVRDADFTGGIPHIPGVSSVNMECAVSPASAALHQHGKHVNIWCDLRSKEGAV